MKPTFMVVGFGKSGTTSLCSLLGQHPQVFMSVPKEPDFFCNQQIWERGFQWYESLYAAAGDAIARGEGSQRYTFRKVFPNVAARIASYVPEVKLIVMARDPIQRIESGWMEMRSWGDESAHHSFKRALDVNRDWLIDSTDYWQELAVYRDLFPDDQILVLFFEDFVSDPATVLRRCFTFLGVDADATIRETERRHNVSAEKLIPRPLLSVGRSSVLLRSAVKLIPQPLRHRIRDRFFFRRGDARPQWNAEVRKRVIDELRENTELFLEFYGKPVDFWTLK